MIKRKAPFLLLFLIAISCAPKKAFIKAKSENTISAYSAFLDNYKKKKYCEIVELKIDSLTQEKDWLDAHIKDDISSYHEYQKRYPNGLYFNQANSNISRLKYLEKVSEDWLATKQVNSIQAYKNFISEYPKEKQVFQAKQKLDSLLVNQENQWWQKSLNIGTTEGYNNFIESFPESKYVMDAKNKIKEIEEDKKYYPLWLPVEKKNNYYTYGEFISKYPDNKYAEMAKAKMQEIETINWKKTKNKNSLSSIRKYIDDFPFSSWNKDANQKISEIEKQSWDELKSSNSISEVKTFLQRFPETRFYQEATEKIETIKDKNAWDYACKINSKSAYNNYKNKFPRGDYTYLVKSKIDKIETDYWNKIKSSNSINTIKKYLANYPNGIYKDAAEQKIIDLEVDKIFGGDYGKLPSMSKTSYGYSSTNTIEIFNNTNYTLTVRYSGPKSVKLVIPAKGKRSTSIPTGNYRVTASVNASHVSNFGGTEYLSGGSYESEFYIQTQSSYSRSYGW